MSNKLNMPEASVVQTVNGLGHCIELVAMDPHFHQASVGLFVKGRRFSVWSYSHKEGGHKRLQQIRDSLVATGEFVAVDKITNCADWKEGQVITKPLQFMFTKIVESSPDSPPPTDTISAKDNKTALVFTVTPEIDDDNWVYTVSAEGEAVRKEYRIRAVVGGYMRYGECKRVAPNKFAFPDGKRHEGLARVLLNYARNVSTTETLVSTMESRGQMTTQTLGFSQT